MTERHELKTLPRFFAAARDGRKRFEVRKNDRNFQVRDELLLREWSPLKANGTIVGYTGREALFEITFILDRKSEVGRDALLPGFVALGIRPKKEDQVKPC